MTPALQIGLVVGLIAGLLGVMAGLGHIARRQGWAAEVQRKIVHVAAGGLAMCLPWIFADDWPVFLLLGLTLAAMAVLRMPAFAGLGRPLHGVERRSYGDFLLVVAVGLIFLFHDGIAVLYILPLAVLTLADAAAALAGSTYGRNFFKVEDGQKSVEGSAVFFVVTLVTSMVCLLMLSDVPRESILILSAAIAIFTTLVEADSWRGFDNLFLPMGVFIFLSATLDASSWDVSQRMAFLVVTLLFIGLLARVAGLSHHVARVYGLAFFMLMSVTAPHNAILPACMLLAQAYAGRRDTTGREYAALDIVGALGLISFGFLAAGEATSIPAISFFGLATGGVAAGHAVLALAHRPLWQRAFGAGVAAVALFGLWIVVEGLNPPVARWYGSIEGPAVALLAIAALIPAMAPQAFNQQRNLRVAAMATAPAALLYAALILVRGPM